MSTLRTYKYRLYPTKEQTDKLVWTLDRCREVYNAALQERRDRYDMAIKRHPNYYDGEWRKQATKEHAISLYDQQNQLSEMKKERTEYQELAAAHLLNDVCKRVDLAFKRFFDRVKRGQTPGYPRFKSKNRYDSFCFPDRSGWKLEGNRLRITRIGDIKIRLHRPYPGMAPQQTGKLAKLPIPEGNVKTCTIKREGEQWYVTLSCEIDGGEPLPVSPEEIGIDLGVTHFAALSDGTFIDNPRHFRRSEKKLARKQQAVARKKRGSKRRKKAIQQVARLHRKIARQRKDFRHKHSHKLVQKYQLIVFEELQPANLSRRAKTKQDAETGQYLPNGGSAKSGLNKSITDAGWGMFVQYVAYKAEWAGRDMVKVNPAYTSQACSGCGTTRKKDLAERWHSCECGTELDRDTNAAINILTLGKEKIVLAGSPPSASSNAC